MIKKGDPRSALKALRSNQRLFRRDPRYMVYMGLAYLKMNDRDGATNAFNKSLDERTTVEGLYGKALVLLREGKVNRAVKSYNRIMEFDDRYEELDLLAEKEEVARALRLVESHTIEGIPWDDDREGPLVADTVDGRLDGSRDRTWCHDCGLETVHHMIVQKKLPHSSQCLSCGEITWFRKTI